MIPDTQEHVTPGGHSTDTFCGRDVVRTKTKNRQGSSEAERRGAWPLSREAYGRMVFE